MEDENQKRESKEKQREALREMMMLDEEMGLYDEAFDNLLITEDEPNILSSIDGDVFFEGINSEIEPNEAIKKAAETYKEKVVVDKLANLKKDLN